MWNRITLHMTAGVTAGQFCDSSTQIVPVTFLAAIPAFTANYVAMEVGIGGGHPP
jgi:hypothetical protein